MFKLKQATALSTDITSRLAWEPAFEAIIDAGESDIVEEIGPLTYPQYILRGLSGGMDVDFSFAKDNTF